MNTMSQIKLAYSKSDKKLSLKAFAREAGVLSVVTAAHKAASKPRSPEKAAKTRLATQASKAKNKAAVVKASAAKA